MAHKMFSLGSGFREIDISLHRCEPDEGYKEPLCVITVSFSGGSSAMIHMSTDELKKFGKEIVKFTEGF